MSMTQKVLHSLFHTMLRLTGIKLRFKNLNTVLMYINHEQKAPMFDIESTQTIKLKSSLSKTMFNEMPIYFINEHSNQNTLIIYLHGGAFINQPLVQHFNLVDTIAQSTNTTIIFPLYPRLPHSDEIHCLSQLESFIEILIKDKPSHKIVLMGDSAGGWLALSLAAFLRDRLKKPSEHLILFSPWCDLTMSNVDMKLEKKDPILSHEGLKQIGMMWMKEATESEKHGFKMNDSLYGVGDIHVYVGSHEIFLPQAQALKLNAHSQGVSLNLKEGNMMIHDFILFPFKQSKEVLSEVIDIIKTKQ